MAQEYHDSNDSAIGTATGRSERRTGVKPTTVSKISVLLPTLSGKPTLGELCTAYVKDGLPFRKKDGRRKSKGTIETHQYHIDSIILPRWRNDIAGEMKPLAIRNWLYDLHDDGGATVN